MTNRDKMREAVFSDIDDDKLLNLFCNGLYDCDCKSWNDGENCPFVDRYCPFDDDIYSYWMDKEY